MAVATRSFKEFFADNFTKDRAYERIRPNHFKTFYEMAMRHDIAKTPVNIDEDDIEFLQQFPHAYWIKAKQMRYNMLFDEIEKLHHERKGRGHERLKAAIKTAMTTQNWSGLRGMMPPEQVERLARHLNRRLVGEMSEKQIDIEADKLAHDHIKADTDRIAEPDDDVAFKFKENDVDENGKKTSSNKTTATVTYMAKPFLNRLYHKLERTRGLPHLPGSGLEGTEGKYGYDMAEPLRSHNPDELPHSTSGMKFPTPEQLRDRMRDFMNLQMHRMFGELPKDAKWLPTSYTDRWSIGYVQNELRKKIESQLRMSGQYKDNKTLEKDARDMAKKRVIELAKRGELKGPPVPGKFPDGIPIKAEGPEGHEKLVPPPLYLPHVLKDVKVRDKDGQVKVVKREIPAVNPAHFFRELGSEESDYAHEMGPDGQPQKKFGPDGQPIYAVPENKLRGHEKQFVHVGNDEFTHSKHRAAGAVDFNHNSEGRWHLTRGDEGYQKAYDAVFGDQRHVILGPKKKLIPTDGAGFFEDIMSGILACYNSQMCGGATGHERAIMLQNIEDVHQIIVQSMLMDLRNPKLQDEEGRKYYTKNKAGSYVQRDQMKGGGTRRLRKFTQMARSSSLDATTAGKEGGTISIADKIMGQSADKDRLMGDKDKSGNPSGPVRLTGERGKGGRRLDTSGQNAAYNLDNFRANMMQLQTMAKQADTSSARAKAASQRQTGTEIIAMLQAGIDDRADVIDGVVEMLAALYQQQDNNEAEGVKLANKQVQSWVEDGNNTSEKLMAAFKTHPLVRAALQTASPSGEAQPVEDAPASEDEKEAIDMLHDDLARMREQEKDLTDPQIKSMMLPMPGKELGTYVNGIIGARFKGEDQDRVLKRVQAEINRLYGVSQKPQPTAMAAKQVAPAQPAAPGYPTPTDNWTTLHAQKQHIPLAHHPVFLRGAKKESLGNLLNAIQANKDKYQPHEYESAVRSLTQAIQSKG